MAVAALLLWLCTVAVGSYLLTTAVRASATAEAETEDEPAASVPVASPAAAVPPSRRARDRHRFDPPSLQRARSEPIPGLKPLAEFTHPALAIIGLGFWLGYVVSRKELFAEIGLGILLGTICAGLSWFTVNVRAAKRAAAQSTNRTTPATGTPGTAPLTAPFRVLIVHGTGAALTLLFAILIAFHA
ncbi:MAG: hypothetical protein ACRDNW_06370 [Trebonia sp.]